MSARQWIVGLVAVVAVGSIVAAQSVLHSGLTPAQFDRSVRPQDDLFRHVNGRWLTETAIPPDRASYGTFAQLADRSEADLRALIEGLPADSEPGGSGQQIRDMYASFLDDRAVNALGVTPIRSRLAEIEAVSTTSELAALIGRLSAIGVPGPIDFGIDADAENPVQVALYLGQSGTALPDRDYYLTDETRFADIRAKYRTYLETVFTLTGRADAATSAAAVLGLETELAKIQWTRVESRDVVKTFNKRTIASVVKEMPGFDWMAWAKPQGFDRVGEWVISQPSFFAGFAAMVPVTPLSTWKAWLAARTITQAAPYLNEPVSSAAFEFFGTTLLGQQVQRDRWKRGVQLVNASLGEALGELYVAKHFSSEAKSRMDALITNLVEAYRQSITNLEWMTPATRQEALTKLGKLRRKIGYPSKWRDYSAIQVRAGDLIGNVERANRADHEYEVSKLGRPVDREAWLMTPPTVNAYYNPGTNEIVFPAGILQPPFFDVTADDAANYGAIGAIIGHEIGHAFDDQGRRFDGDGKLRDWWTPEDERGFQTRVAKLVDQFNAYEPLPGLHVNGAFTLGENIGDLGGLSIAHAAWVLSRNGRPSPVLDGLTGDQRFFAGWAQAWRAKGREAFLQRQVLADPHAWAEFRANGPLGNIPSFYDAFNVQPVDKLYRTPEERVKIW
jgi:predicted metalloendopeptidase